MNISEPANISLGNDDVEIRKIGLHHIRRSLAQGWNDFSANRGDLIFLGIFYPLACLVAALYFLDRPFLAYAYPVMAGGALLGPVMASGFYEMARRRELGIDSRWTHFFDVIRGPSAFSLAALALMLFVLFALWLGVAQAMYISTLGPQPPSSIANFVHDLFMTPEGLGLTIAGNLVGLAFATIALCSSVASFPMLVDRPVGWETALKTSWRVAYANPVTILVWGAIVAGLLILGALTAFVAYAVILPVLGYATWHLYTYSVERTDRA